MTSIRDRTPRWLPAAIALPLLGAAVAGCGDDDDVSAPGSEGGDAPPAEEISVDIVSTLEGFDPTTVTVAVGSEVTWTNSDDTVHTATAEDGTWDSGRLDGGEDFSFTADDPGTFPYVCDIHPAMRAELIVE